MTMQKSRSKVSGGIKNFPHFKDNESSLFDIELEENTQGISLASPPLRLPQKVKRHLLRFQHNNVVRSPKAEEDESCPRTQSELDNPSPQYLKFKELWLNQRQSADSIVSRGSPQAFKGDGRNHPRNSRNAPGSGSSTARLTGGGRYGQKYGSSSFGQLELDNMLNYPQDLEQRSQQLWLHTPEINRHTKCQDVSCSRFEAEDYCQPDACSNHLETEVIPLRGPLDANASTLTSFPTKLCPEKNAAPFLHENGGWQTSHEYQAPLSVFVGNIPKCTSPESFHRLMSMKGAVTEIFCDFRTDCWRTAFVTYSKPSEAVKAVEFFNNRRAIKASVASEKIKFSLCMQTAPPHRLVCCFAPHPPASLCCASALPCVTADIKPGTAPILPFFPKFGIERDNIGRKRSPPVPRFSLLKDGPPGANLFIYGIPSDWTEVTLMRLCQEFGHIVGIRVPGAPTSGMQRLNKGFGFVSYDSTESSSQALDLLSGRQFLGKPLNIQLKLGEHLAGYPSPPNQNSPTTRSNAIKQNMNRQPSDLSSAPASSPASTMAYPPIIYSQNTPPSLNATNLMSHHSNGNSLIKNEREIRPRWSGLHSASENNLIIEDSPYMRTPPTNESREKGWPNTTSQLKCSRMQSLDGLHQTSTLLDHLKNPIENLSDNNMSINLATSTPGITATPEDTTTTTTTSQTDLASSLLQSVLDYFNLQNDTNNINNHDIRPDDPVDNILDSEHVLLRLLEEQFQKDFDQQQQMELKRLDYKAAAPPPSHEDLKSLVFHHLKAQSAADHHYVDIQDLYHTKNEWSTSFTHPNNVPFLEHLQSSFDS